MNALSMLAAVAALAAAPVYADCSYPKAPDKLPDGSTATLQEMIAGQQAVKQFDKDIMAYTNCIHLEHDTAVGTLDTKLTDAQKAARQKELDNLETQKHNAAVDEDQSVAGRFNEQIRVFKAKADKDKAKG